MDSKQQHNAVRRRAVILAGIVVCAIVAWVVFIVIVPTGEDNKKDEHTFKVTEQEQRQIEDNAQNFVETAGSFGVKSDALTPDSIYNVAYLLKTKREPYEDYMVSRQQAYDRLSSQIAQGGSLDYDSRVVQRWNVPIERSEMRTFEASNVDAKAETKGQYIDFRGAQTQSVDVEVTFDSQVTKRTQSSNDSSWDGSYFILQKQFPQATAEMSFVRIEGKWKAYRIADVSSDMLLATWEHPTEDSPEIWQHGFINKGTIRPSEPPEGLENG